jgi:hypothetical protein
MPHEMKSNARRRFVDALVLSALLLFGALARIAHQSSVEHAVCPEHGELLHVASSHDATLHGAHPRGAHSDDATSTKSVHAHETERSAPDACQQGPRAQPAGEKDSHEACWFATLSRPDSAPWSGVPLRFVPPAPERADATVDADARVAAIPTLSFAPKHGPPIRSA